MSQLVAPLVGAWIETCPHVCVWHVQSVAPLVGAWIETLNSWMEARTAAVAPLVGAWIETDIDMMLLNPGSMSHLL